MLTDEQCEQLIWLLREAQRPLYYCAKFFGCSTSTLNRDLGQYCGKNSIEIRTGRPYKRNHGGFNYDKKLKSKGVPGNYSNNKFDARRIWKERLGTLITR